ncbi:MAG: hypothetical protein DRN30_02195 [Thermoplasmata archaeon]|nr:MAG: hypothetical protein DRN30_02195 [Thermoplasmata archaeon]
MNDFWCFEVKGKPIPLARARYTKKGYFYTPAKSRRYERAIRDCALEAGLRKIRKDEVVKVELLFVRSDIARCDIDNLIKGVLDGLRKFFNDNRVYDVWARKEKGKDEKTVVLLRYVRVEKKKRKKNKK